MKNNSPYSSAFTACAFSFYEFNAVLPLLQAENSEELIKEEASKREHLMINNEVSAKRILHEFKRRYNAVPVCFWEWYSSLDEQAQKVALLYTIIKTYQILFDFHVNVTIKKMEFSRS